MTTIPTGRFVWFDYVAKDLGKAQGFYGELFHWKTQPVPLGDGNAYTMIALGDATQGGYMETPPGAPPVGHWISYLQVADAKAACTKIESLGGKVYKQPFAMGPGTMAIVADNGGGVFALWQPSKPEGTGDYKDAAGAFCWNELAAHDLDKATAFYTQLGFTAEKVNMGQEYVVLSSDGKPRAGILKSPMPEAPQAWMPYVQVASTDQSVAKAEKLGAKVALAAHDVPTVGRIAVLNDPQGGWLGVLQPEKQ